MNNNSTEQFLERVHLLTEGVIPKEVALQAKMCLLDYIGVTFAGARMIKNEGNGYLSCFKGMHGTSTAIGFSRRTDIHTAILVNGLSAHVAELDDGHRMGMLHLGAPIISALLPTAELENICGLDFLRGIVVGYEAATVLACSIQPFHKKLGYHTTGTCGTIGAAMAIASALKYSREQMKATLSAAATSAAGILEIQEDASELKSYNAARAALDGFVASVVGRVGFSSPDDILGGKRGFLSIMSGGNSLSLAEDFGSSLYGIKNTYMKQHAACRHSHPAIDAALNIHKKHGICPRNINRITVYTYKAAVDGHDHKVIRGVNSGKMSIPFSIAVALEIGQAGVNEFTHTYLTNKNVLALIDKIDVVPDEGLTALAPKTRVAIVEIRTSDNEILRERVDFAKGEPENPLSIEEIEDKFSTLAMYGGKTQKEIDLIIKKVWAIEDDLQSLFGTL